jgi:16S rRNA (guanine527-N7)-methyltransferase
VNLELLGRGLADLGLDRPGLLDGLAAHGRAIERSNERLGLVALHHPDDLVTKHLLDSVAPVALLAKRGFASFADLGSGAGFPGIPLALAFPQVRAVLIERMERRALFLETTLAELGRGDVVVLQRTFEEIKDRFDLVTFRAVAPLEPALVKKLRRLLNPGGVIAAYKGRREVVDAELATLGPLAEDAEVVPVTVPFLDEERHLVILRTQD